jgi:hypothetical protein
MTSKLRERLRRFDNCNMLRSVVRLPRRDVTRLFSALDRVAMMAAANHKWRVARMADGTREKHEQNCPMCQQKVNWRWPKERV